MANTFQENLAASDTQVSRFAQSVQLVRRNPAAIRRLMLTEAEAMLKGEVSLVDPTNPFTMLMGTSAMGTASFIIDNESSDRRTYPALAQTVEDLYLHMSDKEYIDRFSNGAVQDFTFVISRQELQNKMVLDPATGNYVATIPRYSKVTVSDYEFTLLYNVNIILYSHGHWGVLYDAATPHPLQNLETNKVDWSISRPRPEMPDTLMLTLRLAQYSVATKRFDVNSATGFKNSVSFTDDFCHARVFFKNNASGSQWTEMTTTHSDFVYDQAKPTAVLKVLPNSLQVVIPQIYLTEGRVSGSVRVDVYSTKGVMSLNTTNFLMDAFSSDWSTIDKQDRTPQVAAWQAVKNKICFANAMIEGGKDADSFETLRSKVIMNTVGLRQVPITDAQIRTALQNKGFDMVPYVDILTDRVFLATRALPPSFDERLVTAGNASIETLVSSMAALVGYPGLINNGDRMTITPRTVFMANNGNVRVLSQQELDELNAMDPDTKAAAISAANYLYTPFHYVLDATNDTFNSRPYFLDDPKIKRQTFVDQSERTGIQVSTQKVTLEKTETGFSLLVVTDGSANWTQLDNSQQHAQLSFIPKNETARAYLNGELITRTDDNNSIFEFKLESGFDITSEHALVLDTFKIVNLDNRKVEVSLAQDFELFYASSAAMPASWSSHAIDAKLGHFLLPNRIAAITQERFSVSFGSHLENLWSSSRSFTSTAPVKTYTSDVYATYDKNEYAAGPNNDNQIFHFDANGKIVYNELLHREGDVVMLNGVPVIKHHKGDPMLDANGKPIPVSAAEVVRQVDLFFIEGAYYFATDFSTMTYRGQMVLTVVKWITESLSEISKVKLELTSIFFYPKTSMGSIRGIVEQGRVVSLQAAQSFKVRLFVPPSVANNAKLKESLETTAIKLIDAGLKSQTVTISGIVRSMKQAYGDDVIGVSLSGLGGDANYEAFTALDDKQLCSIAKRLVAQPNGELIVRESVEVEFIRHSKEAE